MRNLLNAVAAFLQNVSRGFISTDYHWRNYYHEDVGGMISASNLSSLSKEQTAGKQEILPWEVEVNTSHKET